MISPVVYVQPIFTQPQISPPPYNPYLSPLPATPQTIRYLNNYPVSVPQTHLLPSALNPNQTFPQNSTSENRWHSSLCNCCQDCGICLQGCLFPCCLYGRNASKLQEGTCFGNCLCYLLCFYGCQHTGMRYKLRHKYQLPTDPCGDCCIGWFCSPCGLCQEAREIKYRETNSSFPLDVKMV